MSKIEEVFNQNAQVFGGEAVKDNYNSFNAFATKLNELGYDVLLNNRKQAEYVPSARLSEVVGQRDAFKTKVEELNIQLEDLKKNSNDAKLQAEIQVLVDKNNILLKDLETTKINSSIAIAAKDAINPNDLLLFVDMSAIKISSKGEVIGIDSEIARLKKEKPYLFSDATIKKKAGTDPAGGTGDNKLGGMNAAIRRAAGITF